MENKTKQSTRVLAIVGLIAIACMFCLLIFGAITHNSGLLMTALFCLIVIPVIIYLFLMLQRILKSRKDRFES